MASRRNLLVPRSGGTFNRQFWVSVVIVWTSRSFIETEVFKSTTAAAFLVRESGKNAFAASQVEERVLFVYELASISVLPKL